MKLKKILLYIIFIVLVLSAISGGVYLFNNNQGSLAAPPASPSPKDSVLPQESVNIPSPSPLTPNENRLMMEVIDVGKGDSILIKTPDGGVVLIDAAQEEPAKYVLQALKDHSVTKIDWLVATHPHNDHIGGMLKVMDAYEIKNIFMPKVNHTTATYKNFLSAIKEKNIPVFQAKTGVAFSLGDVIFDCLSPKSTEYEEINNYSAVLMLKYKDTKILLTGDAEDVAEKEMLGNNKIDLNCDVLKVGHHGSNTSSTKKFLNAATPAYAVISCLGESNGTPNKKVIARLKDINAKIYATYTDGDVYIYSNGKNIEVIAKGNVHNELRE